MTRMKPYVFFKRTVYLTRFASSVGEVRVAVNISWELTRWR